MIVFDGQQVCHRLVISNRLVHVTICFSLSFPVSHTTSSISASALYTSRSALIKDTIENRWQHWTIITCELIIGRMITEWEKLGGSGRKC